MSQTMLFFATLLIGFLIGWLYDFFRILRIAVKHADILTQIEDIIYWVIASLGMFYFMLHFNNGEIRIFTVISAMLGMLLYFVTLSPIFMKTSVFIINIVKKIIYTTVTIVLYPIKLIIKLLLIPLKYFYKKVIPAKKHLQKASMYVKIKKAKAIKSIDIIFKKV